MSSESIRDINQKIRLCESKLDEKKYRIKQTCQTLVENGGTALVLLGGLSVGFLATWAMVFPGSKIYRLSRGVGKKIFFLFNVVDLFGLMFKFLATYNAKPLVNNK